MIRGVIFDLGDTLVTQEPLAGGDANLEAAAAILPLVEEYSGYSPSAEELAAAIGRKLQDAVVESYESNHSQPDTEALFHDVLDDLGCSLPREHARTVLDGYFRRYYESMAPLADVMETLTLARGLSLKLGVLANVLWGPELLRDRLRRLGIAPLISCMVLSCEIGWMKPFPGAYREVLQRMDLRPSEVVMVGDDPYVDVIGAQRAGLKAIWKRLDTSLAPPEGARPHQIIDSIRQLLPAVAEMV